MQHWSLPSTATVAMLAFLCPLYLDLDLDYFDYPDAIMSTIHTTGSIRKGNTLAVSLDEQLVYEIAIKGCSK